MKNTILIFIFIISSSQLLNASSVINDFLSIENSDEIDTFLRESRFEKSYIDKARVTIEHSHFSDIEREYAIRVYTKSFDEVDNEEKLYNLNKDIYAEKNQLTKLDLLKNRYKILIETMYQNRLLHLLLNDMNLKQNSLDLRKSSLEKESDILKLHTIKQSINDTERQQLKYQQKYQRLLYKIQRILKVENLNNIREEINQNIFLDPYKIINYVSKNIESNEILNQNILSKKIALAEEKIHKERIKDTIKLNNIDIKFDDSKKRKNSLSIGVGIEIPIAKNNTNVLEEQLKLMSIKNKIEENNSKTKNRIIELKQDIEYLIDYFKKIDNQISKINVDSEKSFYPIEFSLKIKKQNLKFEKEKAKTLYQMLNKYTTILYLTNRLKNSNFQKFLATKKDY